MAAPSTIDYLEELTEEVEKIKSAKKKIGEIELIIGAIVGADRILVTPLNERYVATIRTRSHLDCSVQIDRIATTEELEGSVQ